MCNPPINKINLDAVTSENLFPADKRDLVDKYLNSNATQAPLQLSTSQTSPHFEPTCDSHPQFNNSLNDLGICTNEGKREC